MTREWEKKKKLSARFDVSFLLRSKFLLGPDSGKLLQDTEGVSKPQCSWRMMASLNLKLHG